MSQIDNKLKGRPQLTLLYILGRILILLFIGMIIGAVFGENAYRNTGYFSELGNAISGPIIIGIGILLFAPTFKFISYWYIYPFVGFLSSNLIVSKGNIGTYGKAGINESIVAGIGIFAVYTVLFLAILIVSIVRGRFSIDWKGIVGLVILLAIPISIGLVNKALIEEIVHPPAPIQAQSLDGVRLKGNRIEYINYCDSKTINNYLGAHDEKYCAGDYSYADILPLGKRGSPCSSVYGLENSAGVITRQTAYTPKGVKYTVASAKSATSKKADGTMLYGKFTYDYCFYLSPYDYHIVREIPTQDGHQYPKYETVQKAYKKYPIEAIIDSYAP
jgi:hypothetical protein